MVDYAVNIRVIVSLFYVGTRDLDIRLINYCQGIVESENCEWVYTSHLKPVMKAIIKVVDEIIRESLNEEVALTIKEKLKGKYTDSEIDKLIKKNLPVL